MTTEGLCTTPNQHARAPELTLTETSATFRGYQDFLLTPGSLYVLPEDGTSLTRKHALLSPRFQPALLSGRTVLDLGANSAFFSFLALQNGAVGATAVDIDAAYANNVDRAARALGFPMSAHVGNVSEWQEPADIVIALALVHWLHNCTATFGTLRAVVEHLARLTTHALVVEWIDAEDPAITFFGHLTWNGSLKAGPYEQGIFERELAARFARVELIGEVTPTRRLFLASKTAHSIDLSCPLPLLHPVETMLSCSRLTTHEGVAYWSRVHDLGSAIVKQTTGRLAVREAAVLQRLGGDATPRVLDTADSVTSSTLTLEKVDGALFDEEIGAVARSAETFAAFVEDCLDLLVRMQDAGVVHRDIHKGNLLIRGGRPVLIDFGWATAPDLPIFTPEGFQARINSSDVHAMGRLLIDVCQPSWPIRGIVDLMAAADPSLRLDDPRTLKRLVAEVRRPAADEGGTSGGPSIVKVLLSQIESRDRQIASLAESRALAIQQWDLDRETLVARELALANSELALDAARAALGHVEQAIARRPPPEEMADFLTRAVVAPWFRFDDAGADVTPALRACAVTWATALRRQGHALAALDLASHMLGGLSEPSSDDLEIWLIGYLCASIRRDLGRADEALADFDRVLARDVDATFSTFVGGALYHSALIFESRGDLESACNRLAQCLELVPDHGAARAALARLGASDATG